MRADESQQRADIDDGRAAAQAQFAQLSSKMRMKLGPVLTDERAGIDAHDGGRAGRRTFGGRPASPSRGSGSVRNFEVFDINEGCPSWENHKRRDPPGRVTSFPFSSALRQTTDDRRRMTTACPDVRFGAATLAAAASGAGAS